MIKSVTKNLFSVEFLSGVVSGTQSLLEMKYLRNSVDTAGRSLARRAFVVLSGKEEDAEGFDDDSSFGAIAAIPIRNHSEFTAQDTMIATAGMCSQMLFYSALYSAICSTVGPVHEWHSALVLLGPWWSSSYWMEWLCYDFVRSALHVDAENKSGIMKMLDGWFPYRNHPEFRYAYQNQKSCFFLCTLVLAIVCAFVYQNRVPASQVIMDQMLHTCNNVLGSIDVASFFEKVGSTDFSPLFQNGFDF